MSNCIITISREYGSGGRLVGKKLAERLGLDFYDKEIIGMLAEESGLNKETIEQWAEKEVSSFFYGINRARGTQPIPDRIFNAKTKILRELGEKGNCVIVGNCGDYILKDFEGIKKFFIYAPMAERKKRVEEVYGEDLKAYPNLIKRKDLERKDYYSHFTSYTFGDYKNYDACLNTALGIDNVVNIIEAILKQA